MSRITTSVELEDGRCFVLSLWQEPSASGLWFVDVTALARPGDRPTVGPFAAEGEARAYLLSRVEREVGRVQRVRRWVD